jgi:hypothetical protein
MPRLCEFYPGIYLTTEEKARKNLNQGSHIYYFELIYSDSSWDPEYNHENLFSK